MAASEDLAVLWLCGGCGLSIIIPIITSLILSISLRNRGKNWSPLMFIAIITLASTIISTIIIGLFSILVLYIPGVDAYTDSDATSMLGYLIGFIGGATIVGAIFTAFIALLESFILAVIFWFLMIYKKQTQPPTNV